MQPQEQLIKYPSFTQDFQEADTVVENDTIWSTKMFELLQEEV